MKIKRIWVASLTNHNFDRGDPQTENSIYLSIEMGGREVFRSRVRDTSDGGFRRGRANLFEVSPEGLDLNLAELEQSSVRLGIEGDDAWQPSHAFVWAEAERRLLPRAFIFPLAFESDWDVTLSTDAGEGQANAALRLVERGRQRMAINRLLLVTSQTPIPSSSLTVQNPEFVEGKLGIQVVARDRLVAGTIVGDTPQDATMTPGDSYYASDRTIVGRSNFYQPHVMVPFSRSEVGHGAITALKRGGDAWWPKHFFLFGLDRKFGRPSRIVPLCYLPDWGEQLESPFSFDATTGEIAVPLPVVDEGIELDDLEVDGSRWVG